VRAVGIVTARNIERQNFDLVNATFVEVNAFIEQAENWADGSIYFDFDFPSNDENYTRSSRDLALEAFENGHSHIIYT
jgi:hypothetical protein